MRKSKKMWAVLMVVTVFFMQGCGGKEELTQYDSSSGVGVGDLVSEQLSGMTTADDVAEGESGENNLTDEEALNQKAEAILSEMTLEEKVYQMFIVTPEALTGYDVVNASTSITKGKLEQYPVGGLIYFADNIEEKEQTSDMLHNTTASALELQGMPIFLCVDEEGGRVVRVADNEKMGVENVGPMSEIEDKSQAYAAGKDIGTYLNELGFTVNMAPVVDVLTNEGNAVIGDRSFGSDPLLVKKYGDAYSDGLHSQNILSVYKHFPGHGATEGDTHEGYAYTNKTYDELKATELVPFADAEESGIDMVMVAHIAVPNVTGDNTPCTLSYKMVTEILRGDLGYTGLIVTDGMNMKAITDNYSSKEATVKAIQAGVDIVLMPEDFAGAVAGVLEAVENGDITEERINESVLRIIKKKLTM